MKAKLLVFSPFRNDAETFDSNLKERLDSVISYNVKLHKAAVGDFSVVLAQPVDIVPKDTIFLKDGHREFWLIARTINYNDSNNTVTISGTDLKGLLTRRQCLYQAEAQDVGTQGYDVVKGFTGVCCAHYVRNNLTAPEVPQRKICNLIIDESNLQCGNPSATYRARFESVADVVQKLCEQDGLCWDVVGDFNINKLVFKVYVPVSRNAMQTERDQVVFSIARKNVSSFTREISDNEEKNVIYATKSGGTLESDAFTAVVYRDEAEIPSGVDRNEIHINVSCDDLEDIDKYALYDATDYVSTDCVTTKAANPNEYGLSYHIGDMISLYDVKRGDIVHTDISTVEISRSNNSFDLNLTFGKARPKPLKKIINVTKRGVL